MNAVNYSDRGQFYSQMVTEHKYAADNLRCVPGLYRYVLLLLNSKMKGSEIERLRSGWTFIFTSSVLGTGAYYGNMEKKLTRSNLSFNIIQTFICHSEFAV